MLVVNKQDIRLAIFILLALLTSTLSWRTGVNSSAPSTLSCWLLALFSDTSCVSHLNMKTVSGWEAYLPLNVCKSSVHFQFYPLPHVPCLSHPDKWALKCCDAGECRYERVQLKGRFHCRPRDYKITSHTEPWGIFFHGWLLGKSQNYGPVMSLLSQLFICDIAQWYANKHEILLPGRFWETRDDSSRHLAKWNVKPRRKERRQVSHDGSVETVAVVEMWQTASSMVLNQEATNLGA